MEHLTGLQAYVSELQEQISTLEATVQKLSSRLDESNLNFKYETLIKTYNEAEIENTALKGQLEKLKTEQKQILTENNRLTQQLQERQDRVEIVRRSSPRTGRSPRDIYLLNLQ
jgi:chromosome segregation ATPase